MVCHPQSGRAVKTKGGYTIVMGKDISLVEEGQ